MAIHGQRTCCIYIHSAPRHRILWLLIVAYMPLPPLPSSTSPTVPPARTTSECSGTQSNALWASSNCWTESCRHNSQREAGGVCERWTTQFSQFQEFSRLWWWFDFLCDFLRLLKKTVFLVPIKQSPPSGRLSSVCPLLHLLPRRPHLPRQPPTTQHPQHHQAAGCPTLADSLPPAPW